MSRRNRTKHSNQSTKHSNPSTQSPDFIRLLQQMDNEFVVYMANQFSVKNKTLWKIFTKEFTEDIGSEAGKNFSNIIGSDDIAKKMKLDSILTLLVKINDVFIEDTTSFVSKNNKISYTKKFNMFFEAFDKVVSDATNEELFDKITLDLVDAGVNNLSDMVVSIVTNVDTTEVQELLLGATVVAGIRGWFTEGMNSKFKLESSTPETEVEEPSVQGTTETPKPEKVKETEPETTSSSPEVEEPSVQGTTETPKPEKVKETEPETTSSSPEVKELEKLLESATTEMVNMLLKKMGIDPESVAEKNKPEVEIVTGEVVSSDTYEPVASGKSSDPNFILVDGVPTASGKSPEPKVVKSTELVQVTTVVPISEIIDKVGITKELIIDMLGTLAKCIDVKAESVDWEEVKYAFPAALKNPGVVSKYAKYASKLTKDTLVSAGIAGTDGMLIAAKIAVASYLIGTDDSFSGDYNAIVKYVVNNWASKNMDAQTKLLNIFLELGETMSSWLRKGTTSMAEANKASMFRSKVNMKTFQYRIA